MHHHRNRLKWKIRNNYKFFIIIVIICTVVASLVGIEIYNFQKAKDMEAILDKTPRDMHRITGVTDQDVQKLKKAYPDFNWENIGDRQRWLSAQESLKEKRRRDMAQQKRR